MNVGTSGSKLSPRRFGRKLYYFFLRTPTWNREFWAFFLKPLKKIWRFAPRFPPWPLKGPFLPPWPRGTHLHEETRKVLSVLLAYVDGLDSVPLPSHASPQRWTLGGGVALRCAGVERPPFCSAGTSSEATVLLVGATNRQQDCDPARLLFHEIPRPPCGCCGQAGTSRVSLVSLVSLVALGPLFGPSDSGFKANPRGRVCCVFMPEPST